MEYTKLHSKEGDETLIIPNIFKDALIEDDLIRLSLNKWSYSTAHLILIKGVIESGKWNVELGEDYVAVKVEDEEFVYWTEQEWKEDPETVLPAINTAIKLAYTNKMELIQKLGSTYF